MMNKEILLIIAVFFLLSCSRKQEPAISEAEIRETEEALIGVNRLLIQKDKEKILEYMKQHQLTLEETETGLWYAIKQKGSGLKAEAGNRVTLAYEVSLPDGTTCYNSDSLGLKQFVVGKGGVESGLEEGILLLNEGSKALFIMPPHLAHGVPGDGNRIPARSILVYQVELIKVEP
ncbi:MAG: FKBP-type peptidyl-prolyl cis-trans isomerase [Bacteroidales bacterium]